MFGGFTYGGTSINFTAAGHPHTNPNVPFVDVATGWKWVITGVAIFGVWRVQGLLRWTGTWLWETRMDLLLSADFYQIRFDLGISGQPQLYPPTLWPYVPELSHAVAGPWTVGQYPSFAPVRYPEEP
jgi:hypothetical protein